MNVFLNFYFFYSFFHSFSSHIGISLLWSIVDMLAFSRKHQFKERDGIKLKLNWFHVFIIYLMSWDACTEQKLLISLSLSMCIRLNWKYRIWTAIDSFAFIITNTYKIYIIHCHVNFISTHTISRRSRRNCIVLKVFSFHDRIFLHLADSSSRLRFKQIK